MTSADVPRVVAIADEIHASLPESAPVFAERVTLFPQGCFVYSLSPHSEHEIVGYALSFPICAGTPPALDTFLGEISSGADQYYIHDVAVLPSFRASGAASEVVRRMLDVAKACGHATTGLISVYGTVNFWGRFGFTLQEVDEALEEKLRGYGPEAKYMVRDNVL